MDTSREAYNIGFFVNKRDKEMILRIKYGNIISKIWSYYQTNSIKKM